MKKARLSFIYFAMFSFIGIHQPFWPVWLKSRGIDMVGIAALSALSFALKIVITPLVSKHVDATGRKREAVVWLAFGLLAGCCLFTLTHGFLQIFVLTTLAFTCWSPIMALAESITTVTAKAERLDYGRIRLWGSIAFMFVVAGSGKLLQVFGEPVLLWAIVGAAALLSLAGIALPRGTAAPRAAGPKPTVSNAPFFQSKWFVVFLLATMLIQGSHAAYYTFASIQWRGIGLSAQTVGLLWGASLVAEVAFFAFGRPVVDRLGAVNVILLGGVAAAVRWAAIGATGNPVLLALAQLLHGISFGASHFAAVRIISEKVDDSLSASGQGLYSAFIMGVGMGIFVLASGPLYAALGTGAFFVMSLVALLGTGAMAAARGLNMARITAAPAALPTGSVALTLGTT
jgi:PPP family 3-phenylpropionic acid transporter